MRIEYAFFTQSRERMRRAEEELAREESAGTQEARAAQSAGRRREAKALIEQGERIAREEKAMPDADRKQMFCALYPKAVRFAECMDCDILVESDLESQGKITLRTDGMLLCRTSAEELLPVLLELMGCANTVWCTAQKGVLQLELEYELAARSRQGADGEGSGRED